MRRLIAVLIIFLGASSARCGSITYSFSGILTDIRASGAGFSYGDAFAAIYEHDDTPKEGRPLEPGRKVFSGGAFSVSVGAIVLSGPAPSELQVFDNWSDAIGGYDNDDGFFVSSFVYDAGNSASFFLIQFDLWDHAGVKLPSTAIPSHEQLTALGSNGRLFIRRFENGSETGLSLGIFGMAAPSPVPEGSSTGFLAVVLVALAGMRRLQQVLSRSV